MANPIQPSAGLLEGVRQDLAFSLRSLRRSPALAIGIVATLALGIGANAAMFSLLDTVFLRPPAGVVQPQEIRRLWAQRRYRDGKRFAPGFSYPSYQAVTAAFVGRAGTAIFTAPQTVRVSQGASRLSARRTYASADFFPLLGVRAALGRAYGPDEDRLGQGQRVALLSHAYWTRSFGSDSSIIGRAIAVDREQFVVVGVAAEKFSGVDLDATDIWTPLATLPADPARPWWAAPRSNPFQVIARVRPGVRDAELDQRATAVLFASGSPSGTRDSTSIAKVGSINAARGPGRTEQEVAIAQRLEGVAVIVLLIACANVINLLLIRATRRRREIAVRLALGVSRGRLVRLLVTESSILAGVAAILAILTAQIAGTLLRVELFPEIQWAAPAVGGRVVLFALGVAALAGLCTGLVPALQLSSPDLTDALKGGGREGHVRSSRIRDVLLIVQTALSVTLLVCAVLFTRSLVNVRDINLGYATSGLLYSRPRFESQDRTRDSAVARQLTEVAQRLRAVPGVQNTALTAMRPMSGSSSSPYFPDGVDTAAVKKPTGLFWVVSPDYFRTVGTRVVRGSDFSDPRRIATSRSVMVNEAMARALWQDQNPLGRCVRFAHAGSQCSTVIGVVETARYASVTESPIPQFYLQLGDVPLDDPWPASEIAIRARESDVASVVRATRAMLQETFPGAEPAIVSMAEVIEPQYRPWQLGAGLFFAFGVLALIVAAVGIHSTVSYSVTQRIHEFGVRAALGARVGDLSALVIRGGLRTVAIGVGCGVVLALISGRIVASLLYGVAPTDALSILAVAVILFVVALVAAVVPAWRAARVDPLTALRSD
jgi:predicted permease